MDLVFRRVFVLKVENISKEYPAPNGPLQYRFRRFAYCSGTRLHHGSPRQRQEHRCYTSSARSEPPTSGTVTLDGQNPFQLKEKDLAAFRNKEIGFIFQTTACCRNAQ